MEGTEAADLMVKEGIQISESALKLLANGGKNLFALLFALSRDSQKLMGKTNMNRILRAQRPVTLFPVPAEDYAAFAKNAKKLGILFSAVKDKTATSGTITIVSNSDHLAQINYLMESMGYAAPLPEETTAKKAEPRAPQKSFSQERGSGLTKTQTPENTTSEKPSVKGRLAALRAASGGMKEKDPIRSYDPTR